MRLIRLRLMRGASKAARGTSRGIDGSTADVSQIEPPGGPVEFSYRLAGGERAGQYAALVISVGDALSARARLVFRAAASQPMRISVQARRPRSGERWQRSIHVDTAASGRGRPVQ